MVEQVRKRTGDIVPFDSDKIKTVLQKAFDSINEQITDLDALVGLVLKELNSKFEKEVPSVEDISDIVETILMKKHPAVAKSFIIYREYKRQLREVRKAYVGTVEKSNLSINAIRVLEARYLLKDNSGNIIETPNQLFERVADHVVRPEKKFLYGKKYNEMKNAFYEMMFNLDFLPNSPTLMNAGTDLGLLSACFVIPIGDSISEIFDAVKYTAVIHQGGGGTGMSFSRLRPRGSFVKSTKGIASGPISFMRAFDAATETIKQGGRRRGANMGVLRVDHPDILEFISCKQTEGNLVNFNISVAITDIFMNTVEQNQDYDLLDPRTGLAVSRLNARSVFDLIANMAWQNGEPGVIFIDEINRKHQVSNMGIVESTNPCITGDTLISTEFGLMRIENIVKNKRLIKFTIDKRVLNNSKKGIKFNKISHVWNNGLKECYKIITESGYELIGTADHKLFTTDGWVKLKESLEKEVLLQSGEGKFNKTKKLPINIKNMQLGRASEKYKLNLPKEWSKELGQILGLLIADGWVCCDKKNCRVGFTFGSKELDVLEYIKPILNKYYGFDIKEIKRERNTIHLSYHSKYFVEFFKSLGILTVDSAKKNVPELIYSAPKSAIIGFLQGLFTADGTVRNSLKSSSDWVALTSKSKKLLKGVQILLLNLGIKSVLYDRSRPERNNLFKYVNKEGITKTYSSDGILYELAIFGECLDLFIKKIGFISKYKQMAVNNIRYKKRRKNLYTDKIILIKKIGKKQVFDVTEPQSHSMISNGLVVHQCGEQPLLPFESCNLGSINLANFVNKDGSIDWKRLRTIVELGVRFLDNVIDANKYPLSQIENMTKSSRKIGLGVMGWADMLLQLKIPYNSDEAVYLAEKVMKFITDTSVEYSSYLGEIKGDFPAFKGSYWYQQGFKHMRNSTTTTIAPTGTIGMIADASSGVEPHFSLAYTRLTLDNQEFVYTNKYLDQELKEKEVYTEELMVKISKTGMIDGFEGVPEDIKKVYVTAREIDTEWHIKMQAAFQKYTHNAVSKTINMPNHVTIEDVKKAYKLSYDLKCKGVTIYRDASREIQILNAGCATKTEEAKKPLLQKLITPEIPKDECPICHNKMQAQEGCYTCPKCSYSKCS